MRRFHFILATTIAAIMLVGASCTLKSSSDTVLQTSNKGKTWESKSLVKGTGDKLLRLTSADALMLKVNPKNSLNLFLGTRDQGLFVSDNAASHWTQMIASQEIVDIALDPTSRCTLFVAIPAKVLRTVNCAESWEVVYNETRKTSITSIALDPADPMVLYVATAAGDVFKSINQGMSWTAVYQHDRAFISRILIDAVDTAIVTVILNDSTIQRSYNKGATWNDITPNLEEQRRRGNYVSSQSMQRKEWLFLTTTEGLWKFQGSAGWEFVLPLTPVGSAEVRAGAINEQNDQELYYATKDTFYHSSDGGKHWTAQVLPTARIPSVLIIDPNNPSILYMGLKKLVEKNPYL